MPRIFDEVVKEGDWLGKRGVARGLMRLATAIEGLSIEGGYIDWRGFKPRIVPGETSPGSSPGSSAETGTCYVLRKATAADVAANGNLVEGQWLISKREFAVGSEKSYEATVPHTCPVVTT